MPCWKESAKISYIHDGFENVDDVERVTDYECFEMTRRLVSEEGILGAHVVQLAGAMKYLKR